MYVTSHGLLNFSALRVVKKKTFVNKKKTMTKRRAEVSSWNKINEKVV